MRRRSSSRRRRRIDRPMGDGIMYASAAGHIRRLVSRHHKTPNLSADHSYFAFCQEFDQLLLTCESLAAASLAWMMNPLNLDTIIVGMMKVMMKRSRISKEQQNYQYDESENTCHRCIQTFQYKRHTQIHKYKITQIHKYKITQIHNYTITQIQKSKQDDLPSWPAASSMPSISPG